MTVLLGKEANSAAPWMGSLIGIICLTAQPGCNQLLGLTDPSPWVDAGSATGFQTPPTSSETQVSTADVGTATSTTHPGSATATSESDDGRSPSTRAGGDTDQSPRSGESVGVGSTHPSTSAGDGSTSVSTPTSGGASDLGISDLGVSHLGVSHEPDGGSPRACIPEATHCSQNTLQECDEEGQWQERDCLEESRVCLLADPASGRYDCGGECGTGERLCRETNVLAVCDNNGRWIEETCASECDTAELACLGCTSGDGQCPSGCSSPSDEDCPKAPGEACTRSDDCSTEHCEDGVCCNTECGAACHACNTGGSVGSCEELPFAADVDNCGSCAAPCSDAHILAACSGGQCTGTCVGIWADCNLDKRSDGCETRLDTVEDCGECQASCSTNHVAAACTDGECGGACLGDWDDCNADKRSDGCETDLSSPSDCGGCEQACSNNHLTPSCVDGTCAGTCAAGWGDCNTNKRSDGCETNTNSTAAHCGQCSQACSTEHVQGVGCAAGQCTGTCQTPWLDCDDDLRENGCETNGSINADHCGGCDVVCPYGLCASSQCKATRWGFSSSTTTSNRGGNSLQGMLITIAADTDLVALAIDTVTVGAHVRLGLYTSSSGAPQTLVAQTAELVTVNGITEGRVSTTPVASGDYWIYFLADATVTVRATASTTSWWFTTYTYGSLPTNAPAMTGATTSVLAMQAVTAP